MIILNNGQKILCENEVFDEMSNSKTGDIAYLKKALRIIAKHIDALPEEIAYQVNKS